MNCRSCQNPIVPFLSLGMMPLVNHFLTEEDLKKDEADFPLELGFCENCYLVQLTDTVDPEVLFRDYIYFSSVSQTILDHAQKTATELSERFKLTSDDLVFEIASNDGYLLKYFQEKGMQVQGIDPALNIAKQANQDGVPTIADFFNKTSAIKLHQDGMAPQLMYGANVLAHVPSIHDFAEGVATLLPKDKKAVAVFEFPYLEGLFEGKFDTIYHEHVFYYSLIAVSNVFKRAGLEVFDCQMVEMQGGSLRIFISHPGEYQLTEQYQNMAAAERSKKYDQLEAYHQLTETIEKIKSDLRKFIDEAKQQGKTIAGYSVPAKGVILVNYFDIGEDLSFIVDKAPQKQGLYAPGFHLKVEHPDKILQEMPDYLLILCWNIKDEVIKQLDEYHQQGGRFVVPIPHLEVV